MTASTVMSCARKLAAPTVTSFNGPAALAEQLRQPVRVSQELGRDVIAIVVVPERRVVAELRRVVRGVVRKRVHFPDDARDDYVADHGDQ